MVQATHIVWFANYEIILYFQIKTICF